MPKRAAPIVRAFGAALDSATGRLSEAATPYAGYNAAAAGIRDLQERPGAVALTRGNSTVRIY